MLAQKRQHQCGNLIDFLVEGKVTRVEQVNFRIWQVVLECLRPRRYE